MTASQRADILEARLNVLSPSDPTRGLKWEDLRYWRTKALKADARANRRKQGEAV